MEYFTNLRLRLKALFRRKKLDQDLNDELAFHMAMREGKLRESGEDPRQARKRFGNATGIKETTREIWTFQMLESIWSDIRYGAHVLRKNPLFTAIAIGSLALGIGANTAVFTLVNAVIIEKLPVPAPEELVVANWYGSVNNITNSNSWGSTDPETGRHYTSTFFYDAFDRFRARSAQLSEVFAFTLLRRAAFRVENQTSLLKGLVVSGNYYRGLGVEPLIGRLLNEADDRPDAEPVAVVSYQLWHDTLGSDPRAIGTSAVLNGVPVNIVGVTPPSFYGVSAGGFVPSPDITVPLHLANTVVPWFHRNNTPIFLDSRSWWLNVMGRMRPGANRATAEAELNGIFRQAIADAALETPEGRTEPTLSLMAADRGLDTVREGTADALLALLAATGLVLLVACTNVATLMLARGHGTARRGYRPPGHGGWPEASSPAAPHRESVAEHRRRHDRHCFCLVGQQDVGCLGRRDAGTLARAIRAGWACPGILRRALGNHRGAVRSRSGIPGEPR